MQDTLYYGDNLDVLRRYISDESVDLIYLDPPFKNDQDYNVLFADQEGGRSATKFGLRGYVALGSIGGRRVPADRGGRRPCVAGDAGISPGSRRQRPACISFDDGAAAGGLRRVLKPDGSIYLHCDPTASHYLKMLMDAVFSPVDFLSEIIWKRTTRMAPRRDSPRSMTRSSSIPRAMHTTGRIVVCNMTMSTSTRTSRTRMKTDDVSSRFR